MKFIFQIVLIILAGYLSGLFFPWYSVPIAAFILGYLLNSKANFLAGFIAVAALWFGMAWNIEGTAATDLTARVAQIIPVQEKGMLFMLTACLGGLVGGFATLTGSLLKPVKKKGYY